MSTPVVPAPPVSPCPLPPSKPPVKVRFTEPRFTRSYQPKSYYQVLRTQATITKLVYVQFGSVHLLSYILHTFLIPRSYLFRFASVSLSLLRPYMPTLVLSSLVSMSYATLFHIYGLLSPFSFSYISSIHCCMYSLF